MSRLSKRASYLLRHGAIREGLTIDNEGCVLLSDFIKHNLISSLIKNDNDIDLMVQNDAKQRFSFVQKNNQMYIKANQGHSMREIDETGLKLITFDEIDQYPIVVHGTFNNRLSTIMKNGLCKMDRNHIHFAIGLPDDTQVKSGARKTANVFIFIDMGCAIKDGIQFYVSENNVILTKGVDGFLSPKYFSKIIKKDGTMIDLSSIANEQKPFDYLVVLDFEATCEKNDTKWVNEIIEWPSVLIDCNEMTIKDQIQIYVKPRNRPTLTEFCTELTGIRQETIDEKGVDIIDALKQYNKWLASHRLLPKNNDVKWTFITCGNWDLQTMLSNQMKMISKQPGKHFQSWINIKKAFEEYYQAKAISMVKMLQHLGLSLQGRHHSGLDDSYNTAQVVLRMLKDGWVPNSNQ